VTSTRAKEPGKPDFHSRQRQLILLLHNVATVWCPFGHCAS